MKLLDRWRELVLLRRIARAQERQADALDAIKQCVVDDWQRRNLRAKPASVELGMMDVEAVNERYERELEAAELGEEV